MDPTAVCEYTIHSIGTWQVDVAFSLLGSEVGLRIINAKRKMLRLTWVYSSETASSRPLYSPLCLL